MYIHDILILKTSIKITQEEKIMYVIQQLLVDALEHLNPNFGSFVG